MSENSGGKSVFKSRAVNTVLIRHRRLNGPFLLQPQSQSRTLSAFTGITASDYQTHNQAAIFPFILIAGGESKIFHSAVRARLKPPKAAKLEIFDFSYYYYYLCVTETHHFL